MELEKRVNATFYNATAAAHRIIASYDSGDLDNKISLLLEAIKGYLQPFNAWHALGYAWMEKISPGKRWKHLKKPWICIPMTRRVILPGLCAA